MDAEEKIDELIELVESARSMPMSASCVLNRTQMLDLLQDLRKSLPAELGDAARILRDRDGVIADGRREADMIVAHAHEQRGSLVSDTTVSREAMQEADRIRQTALEEAYAIRAEADDYVDSKLANFEVVLNKTLAAVGRGREKMRGLQPMEELGEHVREADEAAAAKAAARQAAFGYATGEQARVPAQAEPSYVGVPIGGADMPAAYTPEAAPGYPAAAVPAGVPGYAAPAKYDPGAFSPAAYDAGSVSAEAYDAGGSHETGSYNTGSYNTGSYDTGSYANGGYQAGDTGGYHTGSYGSGGYPAETPYSQEPSAAPVPQGSGPYAQQHGIPPQHGVPQQAQGVPPRPAGAEPGGSGYPALDETSFFDTSLIDVRQLRDR